MVVTTLCWMQCLLNDMSVLDSGLCLKGAGCRAFTYSVGLGSIDSISTWFGSFGFDAASVFRAPNPCWTELLVTSSFL